MLGLPIGIAMSCPAVATSAKVYGWQMAFFLAALPGILCSIAAFSVMQEPKRGASEVHEYVQLHGRRRSATCSRIESTS